VNALIVLIVGLGGPGLLPALAAARGSPVLFFLAPLLGAGMAAVAATLELGVGGTLAAWYLVVAGIVNVAVIAWWLAAGQHRPPAGPRWGWWPIVTLITVLGVMIIPLSALRTPAIGWDGNTIWLTKALMVSGGHHQLLTGLRNPVYLPSNPDYPPLVPAAGALAFAIFGRGELHLATDMTALLNACALGTVGTGVAAAASGGRLPARLAATAAAGAICLTGFAIAGSYGVNGYADLLWAAAAVGAIIWGLVLPPSAQSLGVAWICAAVASLTKNEGLATALLVLALIAVRYRPLTWPGLSRLRPGPGRHDQPSTEAPPAGREWAERGAFVVVPALPGLAWAVLIHLIGLQDNFFRSSSTESLAVRADATAASIVAQLTVAPVAIAVLIAGCLFLRRARQHDHLANPAWLWTAGIFSLAFVFATYVFGSYEIHSWLADSVFRTTIFTQLLLHADLAIWFVIAVNAAFTRGPVRGGRRQSQRQDAREHRVAEEHQPHRLGAAGDRP
jgi:hypothetical protein